MRPTVALCIEGWWVSAGNVAREILPALFPVMTAMMPLEVAPDPNPAYMPGACVHFLSRSTSQGWSRYQTSECPIESPTHRLLCAARVRTRAEMGTHIEWECHLHESWTKVHQDPTYI